MMKVYHVRGVLVRIAHSEPERLKYPQDYTLMAEVPYDNNENVEFNLENAYRLTNSINESWYTNTDLVVHEKGRSTSVGDIVVTPDGDVWKLTHNGYKFVETKEETSRKAAEYKTKQSVIEKSMLPKKD